MGRDRWWMEVVEDRSDVYVLIGFPYDPHLNAEVRRIGRRGVRWDSSSRAWMVKAGSRSSWSGPPDGEIIRALLDLAREHQFTIDGPTYRTLQDLLRLSDEEERREREEEERLRAFHARPPRPLAELVRIVGHVYWSPSFFCGMCDSNCWEEFAIPAGGLGDHLIELRHLTTAPDPPTLTERELEMVEEECRRRLPRRRSKRVRVL